MKKTLAFVLTLTALALAVLPASGQGGYYIPYDGQPGYMLHARIVDGDTLAHIRLREITILPPRVFRSRREQVQYTRLMVNVKKAYPFAVIANNMLREIEYALDTIESARAQKAFVQSKEQEIKDQFEEDLKKLTITQGVILIKLIDRETGDTSYELVQELRGSLSAFFWQSLARLFGHNLKSEYDPHGEDALIEDIVIRIENGEL